jgi:hypothetical protein
VIDQITRGKLGTGHGFLANRKVIAGKSVETRGLSRFFLKKIEENKYAVSGNIFVEFENENMALNE